MKKEHKLRAAYEPPDRINTQISASEKAAAI